MKDKIRQLVKKKNAIILAHNYQPPEIQDVADLCGDSLELSIKASKTMADIIVFCGVHFMAETAYILSPDKTVLLPNPDAGCPMADMVDTQSLKEKKQALGNIPVITYVNSSAAVKAVSDICCTSANVIKVTNSIDADEILMTPDKNLAQYAAANTDKKIHLWQGYCPFHNTLTPEDVN
ncbi:MAG: quinolinate synthase NadA, partial [Desulfobacula sp.]|nr:quinolinate synthase NadA [Desulfobacula sp.]